MGGSQQIDEKKDLEELKKEVDDLNQPSLLDDESKIPENEDN